MSEKKERKGRTGLFLAYLNEFGTETRPKSRMLACSGTSRGAPGGPISKMKPSKRQRRTITEESADMYAAAAAEVCCRGRRRQDTPANKAEETVPGGWAGK
eukprot:GHVU01007960.1.p3 GENE.GHVU01007960.1~~GHVU01007960.1.p3  ORF type:complete len:101 (-),score=10.44 GHVU01007960.1:451-753(-)